MTVATAPTADYTPRHVRPRPERAPVWDWAGRRPKFFAAALFVVVAVVWAVKPSLGPWSLALTATFLFGVGVGRRQRMDAREVTE